MADSEESLAAGSERFILPDGEVLTGPQLEARLEANVAACLQAAERADAQMELARFYLSIARPLQAWPLLREVLGSTQTAQVREDCAELLDVLMRGHDAPPPEEDAEAHADMLMRLARAFSESRPTAWDYLARAAALTQREEKLAACYLDMGRLCEQAEDFEGAVRQYSRAFAMPEGTDETWYFLNNNLGYSLARLERHVEAEGHCRCAVAIDPFRFNGHKNLGLALRGQGRLLEAAACFLVASVCCPGDERAMHHLGGMLADHPELRREIVATLGDLPKGRAAPRRSGRPAAKRTTN